MIFKMNVGNRSKAVSAQDLLQEQLKQKSAARHVNSPHAKYNSRGQLMCIVCGVPVKSAIVWQAHVTKRSHLDNLNSLKQRQQQLNNPLFNKKRKATKIPDNAPPLKKTPTDVGTSSIQYKPKGILKGMSSYSSSDSEDETMDVTPEVPTVLIGPENAAATADVKDESQTEKEDDAVPAKAEDPSDPTGFYLTAEDLAKPAPPPKPNTTEDLPEGFFDDPVADAKARKVEYVDKDQAEWNAFLKEVSAAETTSRDIIADDTEEAAKRNQILQVDEQIELYQRVLNFEQAQQTRLQRLATKHNSTPAGAAAEDEKSDDDSDDDGMSINWRSKRFCI